MIVASSLVCVFSCDQVGVVCVSLHVGVISSHLLQQVAIVAISHFWWCCLIKLQLLLFDH
jgi:hypothetical protein